MKGLYTPSRVYKSLYTTMIMNMTMRLLHLKEKRTMKTNVEILRESLKEYESEVVKMLRKKDHDNWSLMEELGL